MELTDRMAKLAASERGLWEQIEEARAAGASAEELANLRADAGKLRDQQKELGGRVYENTLLRDGRNPWSREYGAENGWER